MQRILVRAVLAAFIVGVIAQSESSAADQQQSSREFARLYKTWQRISNPDQRIARLDELIKLERGLTKWPLDVPRSTARSELLVALGDAFQQRPQDDLAENLEKAIAAYQAALALRTSERGSKDLADIQYKLGRAYVDRIRGDAADNLEKAIEYYGGALTVFTRTAFPRQWADTQNYLGLAYVSRIRGDAADNLEKAIAAYEAALTVFTREASPQEWAMTQDNLGFTYSLRLRGDRADNMENAIAYYEAALTIYTREKLPQDWAGSQNNLGMAYANRVHGSVGDNLEKAITAYQAALTVFTREALPRDWADTQNNLGAAYAQLSRGDLADNLEKAVAAYEAPLTVRTREALPREWAETQNNLGEAYLSRVQGDEAQNVEKAIAAHDTALAVFTRDALPYDWASTQAKLGNAYRRRVSGDTRENLAKAVASYEAALTVFTLEAYPRDHLSTARLLGSALIEMKNWKKAGEVFSGAREAFLLLFGQGLDETEARDLVTKAGPLFAESAFAALQRGETEAALELACQGKARLMAVALRLQMLELAPAQRQRLEQLRSAIRVEDRAVETTKGTERAAALDRVGALRQELLDFLKRARAAEAQPVSVVDRTQALVAPGGAFLVPVVSNIGTKILIVTAGKDKERIAVLDLPELTSAKLSVLIRGEPKQARPGGWVGAYDINYITDPAELEKRWPEWVRAIEDLGPALWRLGGDRLFAALKEHNVKPGSPLFWLPTGALGILSVSLTQDPVSNRRLGEDYEIIYVPSLEALAAARDVIANTTERSLTAVVNPSGDLPGTEKEGAIVASHFSISARTLLETQAATIEAVLAALRGKTHWHFASHGSFDWDDARRSGLRMYGGQLTVDRLQQTDSLGRPRLVVLSACETGLYDISRNADEFIGLPGAFVSLGAAGVLGTLWPVADDATALLMAKFYELHIEGGVAPSTALSRAQAWLREATTDELSSEVKIAAAQGRLQARHLAEIEKALTSEGLLRSRRRLLLVDGLASATPSLTPDEMAHIRPYAHPYFWAGFIYTGL